MAEAADPFGPGFTFVFAWVGVALVVFPLVTTLDTATVGGSHGTAIAVAVSVAGTIPAAVVFVVANRNPRQLATFVVVFVALYAIATIGLASVHVAMGRAEPLPLVEVAVLVVTYGVAYGLVYRDGHQWLRPGTDR